MREGLVSISYRIEKGKEEKVYMIMRYSETKRGCSIGKIFEGTREECKKRMEEIKNDKTRVYEGIL